VEGINSLPGNTLSRSQDY